MSDYEWSLIRQDMIDYGMNNINGKKDFYYDSFGGYTISYPYPIKLTVDESLEGFDCAHLDASASIYYYASYYYKINDASSALELYDMANEICETSRVPIWNMAIENYYFMIESTGYWIEDDCTIMFNIGMMPDGDVWFLTY